MSGSEFDLIYRYLAGFGAGPHTRLGIGDDAAVLSLPPGTELLVSTDTQVEGVHFLAETLPEQVAYRAIAAAASDLVAMGAAPLAMTMSLTLPEPDELWLHSFSVGVGDASSDLSLPLVGGDTTKGPLTIGVTVLGYTPVGQWLTRGGASPGEVLCVTGTLGDSACAVALLSGGLPEDCQLSPEQMEFVEQRFYRPEPRFGLTTWLREHATACIDISDGLLADVGHLADASGVAVTIEADRVPLSQVLAVLPRDRALDWALGGGDDYEIAFTVRAGTALPEKVREIGRVDFGEGVSCSGFEAKKSGYDHFRS